MKLWLTTLVIFLGTLTSLQLLTGDNFHQVIPGQVFRSAQLSDQKLGQLVKEHDIQSVLSLRHPIPEARWYIDEIAMTESLGIEHHSIAMELSVPARIDHLLEIRDFIETSPRPFLVHCKAGVDRAGLASIIVKLMDGKSSLEQARAQVSWKYLAFGGYGDGIPFFDGYSAWLQNSELVHSKTNFNHWLDKEYIDPSGNIHFLIHPIQEQVWMRPWGLIQEGHTFQLDRSQADSLELSGWAFDTKNVSLLKGIELYLDGVLIKDASYGIHSPWLINDFGKEEYLDSGWRARQALDQLSDGCHELKLIFNRLDGSSWASPPAASICIY